MLAATEGALDAAKSSLFGLSAHLRRRVPKADRRLRGSRRRAGAWTPCKDELRIRSHQRALTAARYLDTATDNQC